MIKYLIGFIMLFVFMLSAQTTPPESDEMIMVKKSSLPSNVVQAIETQNKIESVGRFAGIGREIGQGIKECLGALTDEAERFSKTGVGKFSMAMVAFKILGNDIIQLVVGLMVLFIGISVYIFYLIVYCRPKKTTHTTTRDGVTVVKLSYDNDDNIYNIRMALGIVGFLFYIAITMAIIFS